MQFHRKFGLVYMLSVAAGSVAAFVLVFSPGGNWVFRAGLFGLAVAWLTTTAMAFVAIKRNLVTQHKEWTIRSYVVTFAFVFFRFGTDVAERGAAWSRPRARANHGVGLLGVSAPSHGVDDARSEGARLQSVSDERFSDP